MGFETAVLIGIGIIIFALLILLRKKPRAHSIPGKSEKKLPCPLCGTMLKKSEKVKSVVFPGEPDKLMHIFGCPYCYGSGKNSRICPVCKKPLKDEDYVIARVFEKPGRSHVHVLGCSSCRMG